MTGRAGGRAETVLHGACRSVWPASHPRRSPARSRGSAARTQRRHSQRHPLDPPLPLRPEREARRRCPAAVPWRRRPLRSHSPGPGSATSSRNRICPAGQRFPLEPTLQTASADVDAQIPTRLRSLARAWRVAEERARAPDRRPHGLFASCLFPQMRIWKIPAFEVLKLGLVVSGQGTYYVVKTAVSGTRHSSLLSTGGARNRERCG